MATSKIFCIPGNKGNAYREAGIALLLSLVCLVVFYPTFKYGFVSDDYKLLVIHDWQPLLAALQGENFRRPLDELYFMVFYNLFGYSPLPFRIFLWIVYSVNTYLVYRLSQALIRNMLLGCVVAILFAVNTVQFRNIYWISCNLLLFATTFYLAAALVFMRYLEHGRKRDLLGAFGVALVGLLLTKEDLVTFPLTALLLSGWVVLSRRGTLLKEDFLPILRPTTLFWTIPFLFIVFRTGMSSIFKGEEHCPYNLLDCFGSDAEGSFRVSFLGSHIFENLARQLFWNFGSIGIYWLDKPFNKFAGILEWKQLAEVEYILILGFSIALVVFYWVFRKSTSWGYLGIGLVWFIGNLSSTLVLPEHVYPYFSAFPAIGLFLAVVMPLRSFPKTGGGWYVPVAATVLTGWILINSLYWMRAGEKTHMITKTSISLDHLEKDLKGMYPVLPERTNLVFFNIDRWFIVYGNVPKVFYNDQTLRSYGMEDFVLQEGGIYSRNGITLDPGETHVFVRTRTGLQEVTPQFFERYRGVLPHSMQAE